MFGSKMNRSNSVRPFSNLLLRGLVLLVVAGSLSAMAPAQSGRFNIKQVGDALTSYGKNTVNDNGNTYYTVQCGHDPWRSNVVVSPSPNGNVIWLELRLVQLPARISPTAMSNLLKKNAELGPAFFSISGNWLRISSPVANNNMSPSTLKAYLEQLVHLAVDKHDLWDPKTLEAPSRVSSLMHPGNTLAPVFSAFRRPNLQNQQDQ
jgi:hypothetical protein